MNKKKFLFITIVLCLLIMAPRHPGITKLADYFEKLKNNYVKCNLCPNYCVIKEGETGICKVRENINGELYSLVYNKPVAIHIDPIEKKPLFHFYPGSRALSIATAGCNLRCNFCQNWEISQSLPGEIEAYKKTPQDIINLAIKYDCESIAFTYTEPTIFYEYMLDIAKLADKNDLKTVMITCGYINEEPFRELCQYIDAANIDLKGFSKEFYQEYTTGQLQPVLNTIQTAHQESLYFEITNLIIPEANDDEETISQMCDWITRNIGTDYPLHFSRFFPKYKLLNKPATSPNTLKKAREIAVSKGIKYVYIGNIATRFEDTYCPECEEKIIDRTGYHINQIYIKDGNCKFCGEKISGLFN